MGSFMSDSIFFGLRALDRFSFLRSDTKFLHEVANFPYTKLVFFNNTQPILVAQKNLTLRLFKANLKDTSSKFREYMAQWAREEQKYSNPVTFLGMDRKTNGEELSSEVTKHEHVDLETLSYKLYKGTPYVAIDITKNDFLNQEVKDLLSFDNIESDSVYNIFPGKSRGFYLDHLTWLDKRDASVFSQGKIFFDWLSKNKFCSGCGSKNLITKAGTQVSCSSKLNESTDCIVVNTRSSNVSYPRTDMAVISTVKADGKILLGNSKKFPQTNIYSCVAGFMEPGETIETCVIREIWEETNVTTHDVEMVLTQPWPYPGTLMIGCCAVSKFNGHDEVINLKHDPELRDCQWFEMNYIKEVLAETVDRNRRLKKALQLKDEKAVEELLEQQANAKVILPAENSVAFELIKKVVST